MEREGTDFLYPFIEGDEHDAGALLTDLAASASGKAAESDRLAAGTVDSFRAELDRASDAMADRFVSGGVLFTFGNGGSSTDAANLASLFANPPVGGPVPADCLASDEAVLTALANDVGFDLVFSRQLIARAAPADIVIGISTSGGSENVVRGFVEAKQRGLLTIGLAGYGGGRFATCDALDHCFAVSSDSVHRVQETQTTLGFELWTRVQARLGDRAAS